MTTRPSLIRSIPFWVLLVGSLALTGVGAWLVVERLARIEAAIVGQTAEATIEVYVGQPAVFAGAVVLGAGLFGLLLTLAVAAFSTLRARPAAEVVEAIDWTSEDETAEELTVPTAAHEAPVVADATPVAEPVSEDPDVETPSDAPAPARADEDSPAQR